MTTPVLDRAKVVARRKALGLTQQALADRSGVSRPIIGLIEAGRRSRVELETLGKLAAGLEIDPRALLITPVPGTTPVPTDEERILQDVQRLLLEYPELRAQLARLRGRRPEIIHEALVERLQRLEVSEETDEEDHDDIAPATGSAGS